MEINEKNVIMYLRKSRADDSAQQVCEVLAKHELQLQDYAVREFGKKISDPFVPCRAAGCHGQRRNFTGHCPCL